MRSTLPSVTFAEHVGGHRVRVVFSDDTENVVDCSAWLVGPVFEPLKDEAYFRRFFIDGGTLTWPNGADIAPETLYDAAGRAERQAGGAGERGSDRPVAPAGKPRQF